MKKLKVLSFACFLVGIFMVSCTKEDLKDKANDTAEMASTASDYATAETSFEDILDVVEEEAQQIGDLNGFTQSEGATQRGCAEITVDRNGSMIFPLTVTVDFGTSGCTLADDRAVTGIISAVFSGPLRTAGSTFTMTFENLVIDGNLISGTKTITNNGLNSEDQLSYTIVIENGMVTFLNGNTISYETNRTRTWIEGMDTNFENDGMPGIADDVWAIEGTASGLNREGNTYEVNVVIPLRREMDCRWITAGELEIETEVFNNTIVINYGDGTCDDKANASLGLIQREIIMR